MNKWMWVAAAILCVSGKAQAQVNVENFIKKDTFEDIKISPGGEYYAATVPLEDKTGLVVLQRSDLKVTARFALGKNTHINDFHWVNPTRLVVSMAEKFGALDQPQATGELYGVSADGSEREILVGQRVAGAAASIRLQSAEGEVVAADLVDTLRGDDKNVVVGVRPFVENPYARAEKMDVNSGRRTLLARAPVPWARFATDNRGEVRFAFGSGSNNVNKLYYRAVDSAEWELINDESDSGRREFPLGFSADNATAYLQSERKQGPDVIVAYDLSSGETTDLLRDELVDPHAILYGLDNDVPVGAVYMRGKPRLAFFDEKSSIARLYKSLESAFPGDTVHVTSSTADGRYALVQASSDSNPGDFYLFDTTTKKASYVVSRRDWFDPAQMATMKSIELKSRDGRTLHGYVTLPAGSSGKGLPMVVLPHGGPFGIYDTWGFDGETQMLAKAGYAVLQLNFRGSGGYGRDFNTAGAREFGGKMQDDLTDATRWAVQQGIADSSKICIYGASYGAYASLMGVAKEPTLYRCAAGYVGIYDLPMKHDAFSRENRSLGTFANDWYGERAALASVSPNHFADRIKVPVFLAAGGEDEIAPIEHSRMMERALIKAGVPVETLYFKTEGHGFYTEPHKREYYTKLLAFLARHLGGAAPVAAGSAAK